MDKKFVIHIVKGQRWIQIHDLSFQIQTQIKYYELYFQY